MVLRRVGKISRPPNRSGEVSKARRSFIFWCLSKMKMRTGVLEMDIRVPEIVQQLTVSFLALFNRQCLSKAFLYMYHNGTNGVHADHDEDAFENSDEAAAVATEVQAFDTALIRALKYGGLSPNGVGAKLKPYLQLAHAKGYLQPEDYEDSEFATRAVQEIYPQVLAAWKAGGELAAKKWILQYSMQMLVNPELVATEAQWAGDIAEDEADAMIGASQEDDAESDAESDEGEDGPDADGPIGGECDCDFCEEMRLYDHVDLAKIETSDPLDMLMIESLRNALLRIE